MTCQVFAVTDEASLAYGVQSACGTPQTTLVAMRYTSESLALTTQATSSAEIRSDRNITDLVRTSASVGGAVGFDLSYASFDKFIQGLLQSPTALDGAGTAIKNGKTKMYYTMERNTPAGGSNYFTSFTDLQVGSMDLSIQQGAPVSGTFNMMGQGLPVSSGTSLDGTGYTAANTNPIFNTIEGVGDVLINGTSVGSVQGVTFTITNNLREQRALGSVAPAGVANGKFAVTGSLSIYFVNNSLATTFLNDTSFTLKVVLNDSLGTVSPNKYELEMSACKFSNLTNAVTGVGADVILQGDFQAIYNSSQDGTITVKSTNLV